MLANKFEGYEGYMRSQDKGRGDAVTAARLVAPALRW